MLKIQSDAKIATMPVTSSRRAQRRAQSEQEILTLARSVVAESGVEALTLRGLASQLGMAPSGVHYYFASREDLLAAVVTSTFHDLAACVEQATAALPQDEQLARWTVGASAYARWATDQPELFELAHSRAATRLKAVPGLLDAKDRVAQALMTPLLSAADNGRSRPSSAVAAAVPLVREPLQQWAQATGAHLPEDVRLAALLTYIALQGHVLLVLSGSLPAELLRDDSLLAAHLQVLTHSWTDHA